MRFMVIVKASKDSEAGVTPSRALMEAMGRYNQELAEAGVIEAGEGLHPTSRGARVYFREDEKVVIPGPFSLAESLISGYWIFKCESLDEAIQWVKRAPNPMPGTEAEIEIRQIFSAEDFGKEFTTELRQQEEALREKLSQAHQSTQK